MEMSEPIWLLNYVNTGKKNEVGKDIADLRIVVGDDGELLWANEVSQLFWHKICWHIIIQRFEIQSNRCRNFVLNPWNQGLKVIGNRRHSGKIED